MCEDRMQLREKYLKIAGFVRLDENVPNGLQVTTFIIIHILIWTSCIQCKSSIGLALLAIAS